MSPVNGQHHYVTRWLAIILIPFLTLACGDKPQATTTEKPSSTAPTESTTPVSELHDNQNHAVIDEAEQIAALIDPTKLATLKERRANPRIQKITAILITAKAGGKSPEEITQQAIAKIDWENTPKGDLTAAAILRNLTIAERLGATTPEDIAAMRRGNAATVRIGPYTGDILSVDHIIPRSVAPELDNTIANLELMPLRVNQAKGNKIGDRQISLAKRLHAAGLLENPTIASP